ncbi:phytoene dehydrogenase [Corynebacterium humireducens NBRC 106098 = DSM 45392]|uniref:Phytoene dehydrogenase n=1 Tax=Corynebacterium humireducens NBRC 106098 = DSM 45392 TaxID=1223515 RepID=A0A0B5D1A8_9CORY|nr:phytoene dehydrogenase [Corynebacterium humireducens NBRC 106098 = DSM 45392]
MPSGPGIFRLAESLEPGVGEKLRRYLESAGDSYGIAVDRFLCTTFSDPRSFLHPATLRRSVKLTTLITQSLAGFVEKQFRDHRLRQMLTYPAVFLSSHPERTPALYHLMSHTDLVQGVRFPVGGFAAVVRSLENLAREQGVEFRLGAEVTAIRSAEGRATGVELTDGTLLDAPSSSPPPTSTTPRPACSRRSSAPTRRSTGGAASRGWAPSSSWPACGASSRS